MADEWAQYAEQTPKTAPPNDEWAQYAEHPQQKPPAQPEQSFGAALREYASKMNPMTILSGIGEAVQHPIEFSKNWMAQNEKLAQDAETAWKEGRHVDAARHAANYLFNMIPGVGTASNEAGNKLQKGDIAGGLADSAALATQAALGIKTPAIAEGAARLTNAATIGLKAAAPDIGTGAVQVGAGELLGRLPGMEWPARLGLGYPGARQIATGLRKGISAGKAELFPPPVRTSPVAQTIPPEDMATLDAIAMGQAGKKFAKLDPAGQQTVRDIAQQLKNSPPPETPPAGPIPGFSQQFMPPEAPPASPQAPPAQPSATVPPEKGPQATGGPAATTAEGFPEKARGVRANNAESLAQAFQDAGENPENLRVWQWPAKAKEYGIDFPVTHEARLKWVQETIRRWQQKQTTKP